MQALDKIDHINYRDEKELQYWAKQYGVSVLRLKKAIEKVGTRAKDIGWWIKHNRG